MSATIQRTQLERASDNVNALDGIINGDTTTTVITPGGQAVKSVAKALNDVALAASTAVNYKGDWNSGTTYASGDTVTGGNGFTYGSKSSGNIGHNPIEDDGTYWNPVGIIYASNVEHLRSITPSIDGFPIHLLGYYEAGDKDVLTGVYLSVLMTADNGGSVIRPDSIPADQPGRIWFPTAKTVKDFGAAGDLTIDDTPFIMAAINNITSTAADTTWAGGVPVYTKGGGEVLVPKGQYRITDTIKLGQHVKLRFETTTGYYAPEGDKIAWLVTDFDNPNKWAIDTANYTSGGSPVGYKDIITGAQIDAGTYNSTHGIELYNANIKVKDGTSCYGGIRLLGSPDAIIKNTFVYETDIGYMISASWGFRAQNISSLSYLYGCICAQDCNGYELTGYFDGKTGKTITDSNRPSCIPTDLTTTYQLPEFKNSRTGFVSIYNNAAEIPSLISQHWELSQLAIHADALHIGSLYSEDNKSDVSNPSGIIAFASSKAVIDTIKEYNPDIASTSNAYFMGINSNVSLGKVAPRKIYTSASTTYLDVSVKQNKPDVYGWKHSDHVKYLGFDGGVIKCSSSGDPTNIAYDTTYTTLDEALRRIVASKRKDWIVLLKDGETHTFSGNYDLSGKKIVFKREGSGTVPVMQSVVTITSGSAGNQSYLIISENTDIAFEFVSIAFTSTTTPASATVAGFMHLKQNYCGTVNLSFANCSIDLQTGWGLIHQGFNSAFNITASFANTTISGSSSACIMFGAYTNSGRTNVINAAQNCTVSASIKAIGTNGWTNANIIASNF